MNRFYSPCLSLVLFLCGSCVDHVSHLPPVKGVQPSTQEVTGPATGNEHLQGPLRPTGEWMRVLAFQSNYLALEGIEHRGRAFQQLVEEISHLSARSPRIMRVEMKARHGPVAFSEIEILSLLGPPTFYDSGEFGAELVYRFTKSEKEPWLVSIQFDSTGLISGVYWNVESADALTDLLPYSSPSLAPFAAKNPAAPMGFVGIRVEPVYWSDGRHTYAAARGVRVVQVLSDSPAANAGVNVGDIIESVSDESAIHYRLVNVDQFLLFVRAMNSGGKVTLAVRRQSKSGSEWLKIPIMVGRVALPLGCHASRLREHVFDFRTPVDIVRGKTCPRKRGTWHPEAMPPADFKPAPSPDPY